MIIANKNTLPMITASDIHECRSNSHRSCSYSFCFLCASDHNVNVYPSTTSSNQTTDEHKSAEHPSDTKNSDPFKRPKDTFDGTRSACAIFIV